jgi:hypothetical protein
MADSALQKQRRTRKKDQAVMDLDLIAEKLAWRACRLAESFFYRERPRAPDIADFRDAFLEELKKLAQEPH